MKETRYEIRDDWGLLVAVHVRRDLDNGKKRFTWELPDGTYGLGGMPAKSLPLYRSEFVERWPFGQVIFVAEGEKATLALASAGLLAVGTVCGASTVPNPGRLGVLAKRHVILWPDADEPGRAHMANLERHLRGIVKSLARVEWPDAEPGADAADFFGGGA